MATIFPVGAGVGRAEIPALCADLAGRLRGRAPDVVICELAGPGRPGVATVEAIARLRLTAQRHGWRLHVRDPSPDLLAVLELLGLAQTLQHGTGSEQHETGSKQHGTGSGQHGTGSGEP